MKKTQILGSVLGVVLIATVVFQYGGGGNASVLQAKYEKFTTGGYYSDRTYYLENDRPEGCYYNVKDPNVSSTYAHAGGRALCKDGLCTYPSSSRLSGTYYSESNDRLYVKYDYQDFIQKTTTTASKMPYSVYDNYCYGQNTLGAYNRSDTIRTAYNVHYLDDKSLRDGCYYQSTSDSSQYAKYSMSKVTFPSGDYCDLSTSLCYKSGGAGPYYDWYGNSVVATDISSFDWATCGGDPNAVAPAEEAAPAAAPAAEETPAEEAAPETAPAAEETPAATATTEPTPEAETTTTAVPAYPSATTEPTPATEETSESAPPAESTNGTPPLLKNPMVPPVFKTVVPETPADEGENVAEDEGAPFAGFEEEVLTADNNPFEDTDAYTTEGKAAAYLYNAGIIGGYPDGTFKGENPVNRAELAKFLMLAKYGEISEVSETETGGFKDVLAGQWYVKFVVKAAMDKIINGYSDGTFKPANTVNIAEAVKMITLTFGIETDMSYDYKDVPADAWFAKYAGAAQKYKMFPEGYDYLSPGNLMNRNQVAVAIYQVMQAKTAKM